MYSQSKTAMQAFRSQRTVFENSIQPAILIVQNGKIQKILCNMNGKEVETLFALYPNAVLNDFGSLVLMPGIVDSHVHINEPGRTEWEGFYTGTRAAAAGGVTTISDMPLNSVPPTTTVDNLKEKVKVASKQIFVDVAFWAGIIPGNEKEIRPLIDAGVVGFKCFLCPSGVDEFPYVTPEDVKKALLELKSTKSVLAFHAECEPENPPPPNEGDPSRYATFLKSRPESMEITAIKMVCSWCKEYDVRCHIVHLSAANAIEIVQDAKNSGASLTAETCFHYLTLSAEEVPQSATEFKCCPPIRNKTNQDKLWQGVKQGTIDMVVSDHSPCTPNLKCPGDFLTAWGGIASLQFGLPLMWTTSKPRGIGLIEISRLLSHYPAKLCGLDHRKGMLAEGMDADFVIWSPEEDFKIQRKNIFHKNKLTPYLGKTISGKVIATVLRGQYIYKDEKFCGEPTGILLNVDAY